MKMELLGVSIFLTLCWSFQGCDSVVHWTPSNRDFDDSDGDSVVKTDGKSHRVRIGGNSFFFDQSVCMASLTSSYRTLMMIEKMEVGPDGVIEGATRDSTNDKALQAIADNLAYSLIAVGEFGESSPELRGFLFQLLEAPPKTRPSSQVLFPSELRIRALSHGMVDSSGEPAGLQFEEMGSWNKLIEGVLLRLKLTVDQLEPMIHEESE